MLVQCRGGVQGCCWATSSVASTMDDTLRSKYHINPLTCHDSALPRSPQWAFFFFSAASDRTDCRGEDTAGSGEWCCSVKCSAQSDLVRSKVDTGVSDELEFDRVCQCRLTLLGHVIGLCDCFNLFVNLENRLCRKIFCCLHVYQLIFLKFAI